MLLHFLPTDDPKDDESWWLLHSPKTPQKLKEAIVAFHDDEFYRDPRVKSWAMSKAMKIDLVDELGAETCTLCECGIGCEVWDEIDLNEKDSEPKLKPKKKTTSKKKQREFDPWKEMEDFFIRFAHEFAGSAEAAATPVSAAGMTPAQAAAVLGVTLPVTKEVLNKAFRTASLKAHPDRGGSNEAMMRVVEARRVLAS